MHEGKETKQAVVICIEIAVFERNVLCIPQSIHELLALLMAA
jgi:hypothetical protein